MLNVYFGWFCLLLAVLYGGFLLFKFLSTRQWRNSGKVAFWLLLNCSNLLVAILILNAVMYVQSLYRLELVNHGNQTLYACALKGGGINQAIGDMAPQSNRHFELRFEQDDVLKLSCRKNSQAFEWVIEGYVSAGIGGNQIMQIE